MADPDVPDAPADASEEAPVDVDVDALPTAPGVRLVEPGTVVGAPLTPTVSETVRHLVAEVVIYEGARKKTLHVPRVRVAADVVLEAFAPEMTKYRWSPQSVALVDPDGADPEFLTRFEAALATPEQPLVMNADAWGVVAKLPWPAGEDPHAATVGMAHRVAMSHLSIPLPPEGVAPKSVWEFDREVDVFGVPVWQSVSLRAVALDGDQLEVEGDVTYRRAEGKATAATGLGLGLTGADGLVGEGKLRARFDRTAAVPVDLLLTARLEIREQADAKAKKFRLELRADESYRADEDPRVTLKGRATQGGLLVGAVAAGTKVWFNKKKVKVSKEGDFVVGFGRDAPPRALLSFAFDGDPPVRHILQVEARTFEPEAIDGLPPSMVDLDVETRRALAKSRKRISKVRGRRSELVHFRDGFRWPAKGKLTSTYGRKRILNGDEHGYHWGVDIAARPGKKVRAPAAGVVVFAEPDVPLSGNLVIVDHGHGLTSSFLHLQKIGVKVGDVLAAGQVLGTVGNTGRSTGAHLDWRMNLTDTRIDPQTLVSGTP